GVRSLGSCGECGRVSAVTVVCHAAKTAGRTAGSEGEGDGQADRNRAVAGRIARCQSHGGCAAGLHVRWTYGYSGPAEINRSGQQNFQNATAIGRRRKNVELRQELEFADIGIGHALPKAGPIRAVIGGGEDAMLSAGVEPWS